MKALRETDRQRDTERDTETQRNRGRHAEIKCSFVHNMSRHNLSKIYNYCLLLRFLTEVPQLSYNYFYSSLVLRKITEYQVYKCSDSYMHEYISRVHRREPDQNKRILGTYCL